jgi:hypothetical protein
VLLLILWIFLLGDMENRMLKISRSVELFGLLASAPLHICLVQQSSPNKQIGLVPSSLFSQAGVLQRCPVSIKA